MAVHTKIRKIWDDQDNCIYKLSSDLVPIACFAKINKKGKSLCFYKDKACMKLILEYILDSNEEKSLDLKEFRILIIHGLQKLTTALRLKQFPEYLDKCS